ncbi:hypothetical protein DDK22_25730 [Cupriavidus necator]|uniref:Uncharacterized protein n=1 Tax=Cupriavidus necator TaxID=106590 RepID=A0A367PCP0_CUPNE|nr:hypothetical protein DDK22_25730 [Cupriavidus necator]
MKTTCWYGDQCRSSCRRETTGHFVESVVNQVVSKRFVKRQQMAWRPRHAHNLLQIRTAVLNKGSSYFPCIFWRYAQKMAYLSRAYK